MIYLNHNFGVAPKASFSLVREIPYDDVLLKEILRLFLIPFPPLAGLVSLSSELNTLIFEAVSYPKVKLWVISFVKPVSDSFVCWLSSIGAKNAN